MIIIITILAYFCVLLLFSHITARRTSSNETFYRANRRSPWYMVAFGMVGASISGITFVSVPGMVMKTDMTYLQMCLGDSLFPCLLDDPLLFGKGFLQDGVLLFLGLG